MATKTVIAELLVEIGVDAKDAEKAAGRIAKKLKDVADEADKADDEVEDLNKSLEKFSKVGDIAGGFADKLGAAMLGVVAAGGFLAKEVLTVGSRFESLKVQLKTTTGSVEGAEKAFKFIKTFAKDTPFQVDQITDAFVKLNNFGIEPTKRTLTSFGDFASAMGKELNDFIEAVTDATTGEFERLKEFGIKTSSEGDRVKITFRGVTQEIGKNAAEIQEHLTKLAEENFGGAMAEQMTTAGGLISNLQDSWSEFLNTVANLGVLDEFKLLIEDLRDAAGGRGGLAQMLATTLTKAIRGIRNLLQGNLIPTLERFVRVLEFVIDNIGTLSALFISGKLISGVSGLASAFGGLGISIASLTGPVGIAIGALAALGVAAVVVRGQIESIPVMPRTPGPKVDRALHKLAPKTAPQLESAQKELERLQQQMAANPALDIQGNRDRVSGLRSKISRLHDAAIREEAAGHAGSATAFNTEQNRRLSDAAELRALLKSGDTAANPFLNNQQQSDFDVGTRVIDGGGSVEDALAAIGEGIDARNEAQGLLKKRKKGRKKAKKKEKAAIHTPTTVSEFFGAAARGELGPIADRTPSTRDIEPTVAVDITNNNFNFKDTFNITGTSDPVETGKMVRKQVAEAFTTRFRSAGQKLNTNVVR